MAVLTNETGLLLATLAITYILSIIAAVVQKRTFTSQVSGLCRNAADIVEGGWNGRDMRDLDLPLSALASQLAHVSQQLYPALADEGRSMANMHTTNVGPCGILM